MKPNFIHFSKYFQAGDLFAHPTPDDKWIVGQYLGGSWRDLGCLYQFYDGIFATLPSLADLAQVGFVYQQAVFVKVNPAHCTKLGNQSNQAWRENHFRCEVGEQSLDYFYGNNLLADDSEGYMDILLSMYRNQEKLHIENWEYFQYIIAPNGKMEVAQHIPKNAFHTLPQSYLLGTFGDVDMVISNIRREYRDMIFLHHQVFCDKWD